MTTSEVTAVILFTAEVPLPGRCRLDDPITVEPGEHSAIVTCEDTSPDAIGAFYALFAELSGLPVTPFELGAPSWRRIWMPWGDGTVVEICWPSEGPPTELHVSAHRDDDWPTWSAEAEDGIDLGDAFQLTLPLPPRFTPGCHRADNDCTCPLEWEMLVPAEDVEEALSMYVAWAEEQAFEPSGPNDLSLLRHQGAWEPEPTRSLYFMGEDCLELDVHAYAPEGAAEPWRVRLCVFTLD